jgi:hypothetical protein
MGKIRVRLETLSAVNAIGVSAAEAQSCAQNWRTVANDPESSSDLKAIAAGFAYELALVPDTGKAERREYLVGRSASSAAKAAPNA